MESDFSGGDAFSGDTSGYRVLRSGNNIIYTGKICQEGAADFQQRTYDAIAELKKRERDQMIANAKSQGQKNGGGTGNSNDVAPSSPPPQTVPDPPTTESPQRGNMGMPSEKLGSFCRYTTATFLGVTAGSLCAAVDNWDVMDTCFWRISH